MNVTFVHAALHTPEAVRSIIGEALAIAGEHDGETVSAEQVFTKACDLLGARVSAPLMEEPVPFALPRMDIPRGR